MAIAQFIDLSLEQRDAILVALRADKLNDALQQQIADWKNCGEGFFPPGGTARLTQEFHSAFEAAYQQAMAEAKASKLALHLLPKLEAAHDAHKRLMDEALQAYKRSESNTRAEPFEAHCKAWKELALLVDADFDENSLLALVAPARESSQKLTAELKELSRLRSPTMHDRSLPDELSIADLPLPTAVTKAALVGTGGISIPTIQQLDAQLTAAYAKYGNSLLRLVLIVTEPVSVGSKARVPLEILHPKGANPGSRPHISIGTESTLHLHGDGVSLFGVGSGNLESDDEAFGLQTFLLHPLSKSEGTIAAVAAFRETASEAGAIIHSQGIVAFSSGDSPLVMWVLTIFGILRNTSWLHPFDQLPGAFAVNPFAASVEAWRRISANRTLPTPIPAGGPTHDPNPLMVTSGSNEGTLLPSAMSAPRPYSKNLVGNRIDDPMPAMKMKVLAAEIYPDLGYQAAKKRILRLMKNQAMPANRTSGHGLYEVSKSAFEAIKAAEKIAFD